MKIKPKKLLINTGILSLSLIGVYGIFVLAHTVRTDSIAVELIQSYGYLAIFLTGIIGGLNLFVPIPAAATTPIFLEAGFPLTHIIIIFVIGTTLADLFSYVLGRTGRVFADKNYPQIGEKIETWIAEHPRYIMPGIFLYASFAPLPNEVMLVPLGLAGYQYKPILLPLLLGNLINQTYLSLGFNSVFGILF